MTIEEIDALIDAAAEPRALFVQHWDWFVVQAAGGHVKVRNSGGLVYRGLNVWISQRTRIARPDEVEWLDG